MNTFDRFQTAYAHLRENGAFKSKAELARILNRGYQGVVSACNGKAPEFNNSFIADFVRAFPQISQSWLLTGEGEMLVSVQPAPVSIPSDLLERLYSELHALRQEVADLRAQVTEMQAKPAAPRRYRASASRITLAAEP